MADNVVELFKKAKKDTKFDELELRMIGLQRVLNVKYRVIKDALQKLQQAETEAIEIEKKYDRTLMEYAERKGVDNIPVAFLNYTTNVRVSFDDDGQLTIKYTQ